MSDEFTPVIKLELKKADASEIVRKDPLLASSPLVKALGVNADSVLRQGTARRYPDRVVIFQQGEKGSSLYFVTKGDVRLFARKERDSVELGMVHPGDFLGEAEVLTGQNERLASAVAQGTVELVELPRSLLIVQKSVTTLLAQVHDDRSRALDEMTDFMNRW